MLEKATLSSPSTLEQTRKRTADAIRASRRAGNNESETNSALKKALSVLEAMVEGPQPSSIPDLCDRLKLSRQTIHRIVRHLEDLGLVRRDLGRERYLAGPRLAHLGANALSQSYQWGEARVVLDALVNEIGETCNLGMLEGHRVIYIDRVECNWPLRIRLEIGSYVPLHCTAIGKLLLAYLSDEVRERLLKVLSFQRFTKNTLTSAKEIRAAAAEIVRHGYSTNDEEGMAGLIAVGVPVRNTRGRVIAGLALHAPSGRLSLRQAIKFVPKLKAAAIRLQRIDRIGALEQPLEHSANQTMEKQHG